MKRIVLIAGLSLAIGLGAGWLVFHSSGKVSSGSERKILYYRDPMNPQITSPVPKKAADGMDFVPVYDESAGGSGERKVAYYKDPMHPWYTSDKPGKAPDCGMDLVPVYEDEGASQGIRIDPATVQNIGVQVEEVKRRSLNKTIRTVGTISYDERKVYSVNTKVMGWAERLSVDYTGQIVHRGEPLMELYSPELVSTQEEYLQALKYRNAMQQSSLGEAKKGSEDMLQSARRRLLYWDIPESEIKALEGRGTPKKTMTIFSPVDGIVMDKMVRQGQNIMAGMELYRIADLSDVWVLADIYQYDLPWVKVGQSAKIQLSYLTGKSFTGIITFVYPFLSEETKTAKVRIQVPNTTALDLKPDMFATVTITAGVEKNAVVVPDQAVIRSGERTLVVVALGGGYFDPREVKLGLSSDGYDQILDGLKEGEKIVVSSQFLIDSESNLKAAVSQMSGHAGTPARQGGSVEAGGDMSKPTEQDKSSSVRQNDSTNSAQTESPKKGANPKSEQKNRQAKQHEMKMDNMEMNEQQDSAKTSGGSTVTEEVATPIDPVCGMDADPSGKYQFTYGGKSYYFCSAEDMEKFGKEPEKYAVQHDQQ